MLPRQAGPWLQRHWLASLLLIAVLVVAFQALDAANRCDCPAFLAYPGFGVLAGMSLLYLLLCYLVFLAMLAVKWQRAAHGAARLGGAGSGGLLTTLLRGIDRHDVLISLAIGILLLQVFAHTHQIRWINNLSIALAYALLMFRIVLWVQQRVVASGHQLNLAGQRVYIAYGLLILLLISFVPTADDRDPLGTRFQLQILCALLALHLAYIWANGQRTLIQQLKGERAAAELAMLKNQINPHFLFNTLNNLYGLAREKSDRVPELILRLSALLRHTVYQGGRSRVKLSDEIDYLRGYIELQQIRYAKRVDVTLDCRIDHADADAGQGDGRWAEYMIAPMLLIVLLENAYKHGVERLAGNAYIQMRLRAQAGRLEVTIKNNFDPPSAAAAADASGIGLANLKRRLELEYPSRHVWQQTAATGCFEVRLELPLDATSKDVGA